MELEFRQDFERVRENWRLMWTGKLARPILMITIPKEGVKPVAKPAWGAARTQSCEELCDQVLRWAETHEFYGDAVPFHSPSLIIGLIAAFLGAKIIMVKESWGVDTHVEPLGREFDDMDFTPDYDNPWWVKWVKICETFRKKLSGRLVFAAGYPGYNFDVLAALRGPTETMMDFYDQPEAVHRAMLRLQKVFDELYDEHDRLLNYRQYGTVTRHGFYSSGVTAVPQCDFAFSIGKEHFDEFVLPYLTQEVNRLDDVEYHLDGTGNLTHLESICGIRKIGVIQWVPGAGTEGTDWSCLYQEITERGKGLWLEASSPEKAFELWQRYGVSGRMVLSCHAETKKDADRYLKKFDW
jgi:hypothetical protein